MTVRLKQGVGVDEMDDGDIAIIVKWGIPAYIGLIVQRYGKFLVVLGASERIGFSQFFCPEHNHERCRVRILEPGDELIIE